MQKSNGRAIIGLVFIVLGALLITDNFWDVNIHIFSWPVVFIIIGAIILSNSHRSPGGLFLFLFGILGILSQIFEFSIKQLFADYWPAALILFGLYIIMQPRKIGNANCTTNSNLDNDYIDETVIFSDNRRKITSANFKGGKITTLFGSTLLNLREAVIAENNSTLDILAIFGGITIEAGNDVNIILNVTSIFGGFNDKRKKNPNEIPQFDKSLIIKGFILFGGGEIRN